MDGVGIIIAVIVVSFFSGFEANPVNPNEISPHTTIRTVDNSGSTTSADSFDSDPTVQRAATASEPENVPVNPAQPVSQAPATAPTQSAVAPQAAQNADYSGIGYQFVAYDRMDVVIRRYNPSLTESEANQIKMATNIYCKERNIDPRLALAVMARESRFDPKAVSSSGAIGLGQIMPFNYSDLGIDNPNDINQNVKGTVLYMSQKFNDWASFPNQLQLGLASYLRGTGEIQRQGGQYDDHTKAYMEEILRIRASI
ncbi:lytic murein transglycosylase [Candidatus Termititenax persephonae]|uniref:Lytic murein transglycosylase n=1 Tax=Candidatus Termititenax persephonae TaxID=2218525 RepID=A0A388TJ83_9BACT|nr:lytic murein transglycosylase [Candidatus Termititenax persephonae]